MTSSVAVPRRSPLTVAEATALANRLAIKIAHRYDDVQDLVQTGLLKLHVSLKRTTGIQDYVAFATTCMQREMWRYYSRGGKNRRVLDRATSLDVEPKHDRLGNALLDFAHDPDLDGQGPESHALPSSAASQTEMLELSEYFRLLEQQHGATARRVAENLFAPQDVQCCQYILEGRRRSRKNGAERGIKRHIRLSHSVIREGLGLSWAEWSRQLEIIRTFTLAWVRQ